MDKQGNPYDVWSLIVASVLLQAGGTGLAHSYRST